MGVFNLKAASLALSAVLLATSFTPSQAFTQIPVPVTAERANVEIVQISHRDGHYRPRYSNRRQYSDRRGYYRRGGYSYYNGHRGYNYYRRGYREYNGWWFPLGAFATGAIIGGAIAQPPVRYGGSHAEWCYNRYRSYRAYDNTYQPYGGPRRQCISPY
ncbi:BA14K family protein [Pararhizobium sp. YC-54]|uniref:BA14K family protein n=1 Tax=Pararhizobium sp. YC-54 TaxID=2986920 RepID=UPI0021F7ECD0|nr:BA14K family protein [Pararhizobium sp. YC-54]MCW0000439.1 BA14K family protein [Pararhizobium sp. YC-54]